jgi:hypothetical protein
MDWSQQLIQQAVLNLQQHNNTANNTYNSSNNPCASTCSTLSTTLQPALAGSNAIFSLALNAPVVPTSFNSNYPLHISSQQSNNSLQQALLLAQQLNSNSATNANNPNNNHNLASAASLNNSSNNAQSVNISSGNPPAINPQLLSGLIQQFQNQPVLLSAVLQQITSLQQQQHQVEQFQVAKNQLQQLQSLSSQLAHQVQATQLAQQKTQAMVQAYNQHQQLLAHVPSSLLGRSVSCPSGADAAMSISTDSKSPLNPAGIMPAPASLAFLSQSLSKTSGSDPTGSAFTQPLLSNTTLNIASLIKTNPIANSALPPYTVANINSTNNANPTEAENRDIRSDKHLKTAVQCGWVDPDTNQFHTSMYVSYFEKEVEVFTKLNLSPEQQQQLSQQQFTNTTASSDDALANLAPVKGELLFRASSAAAKCGCSTNKVAMYLARRRFEISGIYQATVFSNKPNGRSGLKHGGYFLSEAALQDCWKYFKPRMNKKSKKFKKQLQIMENSDVNQQLGDKARRAKVHMSDNDDSNDMEDSDDEDSNNNNTNNNSRSNPSGSNDVVHSSDTSTANSGGSSYRSVSAVSPISTISSSASVVVALAGASIGTDNHNIQNVGLTVEELQSPPSASAAASSLFNLASLSSDRNNSAFAPLAQRLPPSASADINHKNNLLNSPLTNPPNKRVRLASGNSLGDVKDNDMEEGDKLSISTIRGDKQDH